MAALSPPGRQLPSAIYRCASPLSPGCDRTRRSPPRGNCRLTVAAGGSSLAPVTLTTANGDATLTGTPTSPTARRWELAARLRALRVQAGVSLEDAAGELLCSVAKISRMETAGRGVQPRDVRDLARLYKVPDDVRDELMELALEARKSGWWQDFRNIDDQQATFFGLETAAQRTYAFEALRVPGLLQTADFARALISSLRPPGELTDAWIEDVVSIRGIRQARISSGDLSLHAIIDEAAVRRPAGSAPVMAAQMERLIAEAQRPNVTLQAIPFAGGPHPGLDGSFQHLSFPNGLIGDVVYVEGLVGNFFLDKEAEVSHYRLVFDDLADRVALSADDTLVWLETVSKEWRSMARPQRRARG
jgi:transcriptional regulator with XRE-family HTH domain